MRYESRVPGSYSNIDGYYDSEYEYSLPITYAYNAQSLNNIVLSPFGPDSEVCLLGVSANNNILNGNIIISFDSPTTQAVPNTTGMVANIAGGNANAAGFTGYQIGLFYSSFTPPELWVPVDNYVSISAIGSVFASDHCAFVTLMWRMKRVHEIPSAETHKQFTNPDE